MMKHHLMGAVKMSFIARGKVIFNPSNILLTCSPSHPLPPSRMLVPLLKSINMQCPKNSYSLGNKKVMKNEERYLILNIVSTVKSPWRQKCNQKFMGRNYSHLKTDCVWTSQINFLVTYYQDYIFIQIPQWLVISIHFRYWSTSKISMTTFHCLTWRTTTSQSLNTSQMDSKSCSFMLQTR